MSAWLDGAVNGVTLLLVLLGLIIAVFPTDRH